MLSMFIANSSKLNPRPMPLLLKYNQWMKETHSMIKSRSESLKKIDAALNKPYPSIDEVKRALIGWIDEQNRKKQDWHRSVRNGTKVVERLAREVGYMEPSNKVSLGDKLAESEAKSLIRSQIRRASQEMFQGKEVVFSNVFLQAIHARQLKGNQKLKNSGGKLGRAGAVGMDLKGAGSGAKDVRSIVEKLTKAIDGMMHGVAAAKKSELIAMALGAGAADFALACAPLVGTLASGVKTAADLIKVIMGEYALDEMNERKGDVRPGDAAGALAAIAAIIEKEIMNNGKKAAIHGSAFAAKAGVLCAGAPGADSLIGAAEGLLILVHNLHELVKAYKEMNAANEKIRQGNIDVTIFSTCPILGCYYVLVQGDFTLMNFDVANMGKQNWMQEILRLKYALEPVKAKAASLIGSSSIIVEGMERMQGVYQESMWHKVSQPFKDKFGSHTSKPGTSIAGPAASTSYQLPPLSSGLYSEKELEFLRMFGPV